MKFFTRIAILFYVVTISTLGALTITLVLTIDQTLIEQIIYALQILQTDSQIKILVGLGGVLFVLLSLIFARIISGVRQKERTIAFDNPNGRVTISLIAIEDMVKRLILREQDVKEARPNIIATKKGLDIEARLILKADVSIPDVTARLQDLIKSKIQDIMGIEETVTVKIHVMKISTEETKQKKNKSDYSDRVEPTIPFQGYRA